MARRAVLAWCALAALAGPAAALAESRAAWVTPSDDTRAVAEQQVLGSGCRLRVVRDGSLLWSMERCVAGPKDYRFLSNDGLSLMVLYAFPEQGEAPKAARAGALYKRGQKAKEFRVGQFVADLKPLVMTSAHFYWLEGAMGQPGVPPGTSRDGRRVELTTLDRRNFMVSFDGEVQGPLPAQLKSH